jgi:hypothetical protein
MGRHLLGCTGGVSICGISGGDLDAEFVHVASYQEQLVAGYFRGNYVCTY